MGGKNSGRKRDMSEEAFNKHFERCNVVQGENEEIVRRVGLAIWRNLVTYNRIDKENGAVSFVTHDNMNCSISKNGCHAVMVINDNGNVFTVTKTWAKHLFDFIMTVI